MNYTLSQIIIQLVNFFNRIIHIQLEYIFLQYKNNTKIFFF